LYGDRPVSKEFQQRYSSSGNWASVDHLFMEQKDMGITMVISNAIVWINQKNLTIFFITIF
jgi:hypothetical protein